MTMTDFMSVFGLGFLVGTVFGAGWMLAAVTYAKTNG